MNQDKSVSEMIALFRYGIVANLLSVTKGGDCLKDEILRLSKKTWLCPNGQMVRYSFPTIEEWYCDFKKFGFPGLMPKCRKDKGISRALDEALAEEIKRRPIPNSPLPRLIRQLMEENRLIPGQVLMATIYRFMQRSGLKDFSLKEPKERRAADCLLSR